MDEGAGKAIPLRRSRGKGRGVRVASSGSGGILPDLTAGVRAVLSPPRQLWLAGLGGSALALRGVRSAWSRMVEEGRRVEERAEGWVRTSLRTRLRVGQTLLGR
jgi:hypothetical protein